MSGFNIKTEKILSMSNIKRIIMLGISLKDSISALEDKCIEDYDSTKTYVKNSLVIYNGYIYKTKTVTTGDFDENKFEKIGDDLDLLTLDDIKALINLSDEEIASLQSLISTEIRLDKCFSSSDAYNRILNAENECKKFTLEQLAKKAGVVYKVVADTTGVDSTEFLYLIPNGSNGYNIYAYIDGSAVKISDTNINLDSYAKLSDLDDFVKKTDADGKYALITTVDKKAEKTDLDNHMNDTVSHMTQSEKDSYALKSSITDTIDSTSTSTDIASAKSVYDFKNYTIINYPDLRANNTITVFTDLVKLVPINKTWYIVNFKEESLDTADAIEKFGFPTNMNAWGNIQITCKQRFDVYRSYYIELQTDDNSQFTYRWLGECTSVESQGVEAYAIKWRMLCSTNVADVSVTNIKFTSTTNYKPSSSMPFKYTVSNGICYVTGGIQCVSPKDSDTQVSTLPKPKTGYQYCKTMGIASNATDTNTPLLLVGTDGELFLSKGVAKGEYRCTFSYPVA